MTFHILTIFPHIFDSYFNESILRRAQEAGKIEIKVHDLRNWTKDKHKTVDDTPYGGGAGMVMKVEPIYKALKPLKSENKRNKIKDTNKSQIKNLKTILLSARGGEWTQAKAREYSKLDEVILICGRYEGVDERITNFIDEEISIGDYVLTGGEIPAMAIVDSVARLIPGVLGNVASPESESHTEPGVLEYPQYTRPEVFIDDEEKKYKVPPVLLSGNHGKIEEWRKKQRKILE